MSDSWFGNLFSSSPSGASFAGTGDAGAAQDIASGVTEGGSWDQPGAADTPWDTSTAPSSGGLFGMTPAQQKSLTGGLGTIGSTALKAGQPAAAPFLAKPGGAQAHAPQNVASLMDLIQQLRQRQAAMSIGGAPATTGRAGGGGLLGSF
jgi:hypothetical protein